MMAAYFTLFHSVTSYGMEWGGAVTAEKLFSLERRVARI